jgi:drug/metabolite transporter (DMT)-like permease
MIGIILWTIIFSLSSAISIVLLGSRELIGGNLFDPKVAFGLILSWQFILAMSLAVFSRFSFIIINNLILKIPSLAPAATTITAFISAMSFIVIMLCNYFFLHERLSTNQLLGAGIIIIGIIVLIR